MHPDIITSLILEYRYWILIPLTFLEGPVIAFIAGTLASAGYFNMYVLAVLFFVRDVGLDGVYYALGFFGGRTRLAQRMLHKLGITESHLDDVRMLWERHPGKAMFFGKLSYGIASAFIFVAGMVRMRLPTFFMYGSVVAVAQYGTLLFLGYFFGTALGANTIHIIDNIQYIIAGGAVLISGYYIFTWYMRKRFIKEETK